MRRTEVEQTMTEYEYCEECGEPSIGVTMWEGMEGWSCPYCGHYTEFDGGLRADGGTTDIERFEVTAVTWIDDDGQRYRRTIDDGEIVDRLVVR